MQVIMENWRRYSAKGNIPLPSTQQVNNSKVFLFEGKESCPSSTRTFGSLFEDLENNKVDISEALKIWERSTLYEMEMISSSSDELLEQWYFGEKEEQEILEEVWPFGKKKKETSEEPSEKLSKKGKITKKMVKYGSIAMAHAVAKGYQFIAWIRTKSSSMVSGIIGTVFGEDPESSVVFRTIKKLASIVMKIIKAITSVILAIWKRYSKLISSPWFKLCVIAMCVAMCTLSLWLPFLAAFVPIALSVAGKKTMSLARSAVLKLITRKIKKFAKNKRSASIIKKHAGSFEEAMQKAEDTGDSSDLMPILKDLGMEDEIARLQKAIKQDEKSIAAEGKDPRLIQEGLDWDEIAELGDAIGNAIMVLVEEVGESKGDFATEVEMFQTQVGGDPDSKVALANLTQIYTEKEGESTRIGIESIRKLQALQDDVGESKNKKQAAAKIEEFIKAANAGDEIEAKVAANALEMSKAMCKFDPEDFCGAQNILSKAIKIDGSSSDGFNQGEILRTTYLNKEGEAGESLYSWAKSESPLSISGNPNQDLDAAGEEISGVAAKVDKGPGFAQQTKTVHTDRKISTTLNRADPQGPNNLRRYKRSN